MPSQKFSKNLRLIEINQSSSCHKPWPHFVPLAMTWLAWYGLMGWPHYAPLIQSVEASRKGLFLDLSQNVSDGCTCVEHFEILKPKALLHFFVLPGSLILKHQATCSFSDGCARWNVTRKPPSLQTTFQYRGRYTPAQTQLGLQAAPSSTVPARNVPRQSQGNTQALASNTFFCRAQCVTCFVVNWNVLNTCSPPPTFYRRLMGLVKVHSLKWLARCSSGCPTPKLKLVLFSETADQWQLRAHCCIPSLQLTAMAEDLPCKLGTSVEMVWVTWDDLHPLFRHVFFDYMSIKKDFLTENVLDTLTLQLLVGPRHSIFTSIHCSKQASPGRGMLRCIQGSQGLRCDSPNCWDVFPFELEKQGCA